MKKEESLSAEYMRVGPCESMLSRTITFPNSRRGKLIGALSDFLRYAKSNGVGHFSYKVVETDDSTITYLLIFPADADKWVIEMLQKLCLQVRLEMRCCNDADP